jgi:LmbE family N-acetylglucosaminyl deacetylase
MNYKRILVFGAHPDDEQTMAGTMAKLADLGVEIYLAIFTDGREGYPEAWMKDNIIEMRRAEGEASDQVLGVKERYRFERPDTGLVNDTATFKETIQLIRRIRPDAVFNHGPHDRNRDHIATNAIVLEAVWQGGQPVCAELGEPWDTPHFFYYKGVADREPDLLYDITGYAHKHLESRATQKSQHTLFKKAEADFAAEIAQMKRDNPAAHDRFWLTGRTPLRDFPDITA